MGEGWVGVIVSPGWEDTATTGTRPKTRRRDGPLSDLKIVPFDASYADQVIRLSVDAWTPVFAKTKNDVPKFVYDAFYPQGWELRQTADVAALLSAEPENIWLAFQDDDLVGFIGIHLHPQDRMGEVHIVAVAPNRQRQGVGRRLMQFAEQRIRDGGMKMVMVETVGDRGHEPARRAYEALGFERWPVARYFKKL